MDKPAKNSKIEQTQLHVQVCYALEQTIFLVEVVLERNSTIRDAIESSQILLKCPEIDIDHCRVGIYGKLKLMTAVLAHGDRVEIYRPLIAGPMEARRRRASARL
jgi:putative ubiquitin-RnfH superfamily antitoxin RatB of RatAB toxin-antitoxin module